jgi:type II secretory pathway pseudopilin PulG
MNQYFKKNKYNKGISMVELIVVISIFLILTSITIFNYGQFRSSISLQNLADDIALVIRKAQSYSTGVQQGEVSQGVGSFGVHFTADDSQVGASNYYGSNKLFVLFQDISRNQAYNYVGQNSCGTPTSGNECLEAFRIKSNDIINKISYRGQDGELDFTKINLLYIVFERPNTEPKFYKQVSLSNTNKELLNTSYVKIYISSSSEPTIQKTITIYSSGQISVSS